VNVVEKCCRAVVLCEIKPVRTGGVQKKWAFTVGSRMLKRKKKVTAGKNKKNPKGKVKSRMSERRQGQVQDVLGRRLNTLVEI
jgi:hypothetical protein